MTPPAIRLAEAQRRVTLIMGHLAAQFNLKRPNFDQLYETSHKLREAIGLVRILSTQVEQEGVHHD